MPSPFSAQFFRRYQSTLLRLLNSPVLAKDMRAALWIQEDAPIVRLTPNAVHAWLGKDNLQATIYSNKQYAEALHHSFGWIWKTAHTWDQFIANTLRPAWNLGFDTYTSQPDGTDGLDATLQSTTPTTNHGTNPNLDVGESNAGTDVFRTLIKFDFSSLASPLATPSAAVFSLWLHTDFSSTARTFRLYRTKRDWVEAEATWNIWKTGNSWSTAGGFHVDDCEQTGIATRAMTDTESADEKQWTDFDMTLLKDMWDGDWTNNGFLIKADTESNDWYRFRSSDYATAGERPKMVITYSLASGNFFAVLFKRKWEELNGVMSQSYGRILKPAGMQI